VMAAAEDSAKHYNRHLGTVDAEHSVHMRVFDGVGTPTSSVA
jgi:hypothetical protein